MSVPSIARIARAAAFVAAAALPNLLSAAPGDTLDASATVSAEAEEFVVVQAVYRIPGSPAALRATRATTEAAAR